MSNLKEILKPKASKSISSKTPKFYNEEKNRCLNDLAISPIEAVRNAIASNPHTPTGILSAMLEVEQHLTVLKTVLLNPKLPRKAVLAFVSNDADARVNFFANDQEVIDHFKQS
jgi:hypothetical protein